MKKASLRTIKVAQKIARSNPHSPARMVDEKDRVWTIQWNELHVLARTLLALSPPSKHRGR